MRVMTLCSFLCSALSVYEQNNIHVPKILICYFYACSLCMHVISLRHKPDLVP